MIDSDLRHRQRARRRPRRVHGRDPGAARIGKVECEKEFAIAVGILEDSRKLIAAGKIQRWDVIKWSVTVNIALAAAAAAGPALFFRLCLLVLSASVLLASWRLVVHYNGRMKGAQDRAVTIVKWLKSRGVDHDAIAGGSVEDEYSVPREKYDRTEFCIFLAILAVSPVLIFLSLFLHH